jgi:hypothetical protein
VLNVQASELLTTRLNLERLLHIQWYTFASTLVHLMELVHSICPRELGSRKDIHGCHKVHPVRAGLLLGNFFFSRVRANDVPYLRDESKKTTTTRCEQRVWPTPHRHQHTTTKQKIKTFPS